jgi:hypothetical protein
LEPEPPRITWVQQHCFEINKYNTGTLYFIDSNPETTEIWLKKRLEFSDISKERRNPALTLILTA